MKCDLLKTAVRQLAICLLLGWPLFADDDPHLGVLTLVNGNSVAGELQPSQGAEAIHWWGTDFITPFQFRTQLIKSIKYPIKPIEPATGHFVFDFVNGDSVSGKLLAWDSERIEIQSTRTGTVAFAPAAVLRVYRVDEHASLPFASLAGLQDWGSADWTNDGWMEDGESLRTRTHGSALNGNLKVPDRAVIEFDLAWGDRPDFVLAVGVDEEADRDLPRDGWRFETAANRLFIVREQDQAAEIQLLRDLSNLSGIRLTAYLDQKASTIEVVMAGQSIGKVTVPPDDRAKVGRGVRIINRRGNDLTLERLRIAAWIGEIPAFGSGDTARIALKAGTAVSALVTGYDAKSDELLVDGDQPRWKMPEIVAIDFEVSQASSEQAENSPDAQKAQCVSFLQDGTRISGKIDSVDAHICSMHAEQFIEPIKFNHSDLRTLIVFDNVVAEADNNKPGRIGRLELGPHQLTGHLVAAEKAPHNPDADVLQLSWHPFGSLNASPLKSTANGRIVYRDTATEANASPAGTALELQQQRVKEQNRGLNFGELFLRRADNLKEKMVTKDAHVIHVRTGDIVPCIVQSIDDSGVHVTTKDVEDRLVPLHQIKAIEFYNGSIPPDLVAAKRDRLLTIPRLQKSNPPTHLLCSHNGDFLRCRLLRMDKDTIVVEVQLEELEIPRDRVSHLIAFYADEWETAGVSPQSIGSTESATEEGSTRGLVQAINRDGKRMTFRPAGVTDRVIQGHSDLLGVCRFDIAEIDQLIFNHQIRLDVSNLAYNQWKLHPAVEPLVTAAMEGSDVAAGEQSPLVGTEAPEIKLDLLAGGRLQLSSLKGKIVVLDFWASWCAPCMLTMPLVQEAIAEIDSDQVQLYAINLEEPADHIREVLERHNLNVTVALDIDGVAAQRYEATAIPQLVIISPAGMVHKLFVGGGASVVEQMKTVIAELMEAPAEAPAE